MTAFDPLKAAQFIADAHDRRETFRNLPAELAPPDMAQAYRAQAALAGLWAPRYGPVRGRKIATTTKVMQALMGIDHPIGGLIFERRMLQAPARLRSGDFIHLMVECELAVRLAKDLDASEGAWTRETVRGAVGEVMAAFELIEDRRAVYKESDARTLIVDDAWNAGIVMGAAVPDDGQRDLNGVAGRLTVNGALRDEGRTDDPMGALAWLANLAVEQGDPLRAGMVVITGSVVATLPIEPGETFQFELDGIGTTQMQLVD